MPPSPPSENGARLCVTGGKILHSTVVLLTTHLREPFQGDLIGWCSGLEFSNTLPVSPIFSRGKPHFCAGAIDDLERHFGTFRHLFYFHFISPFIFTHQNLSIRSIV